MLAPPSADNGQSRCRDAPPSLVRQDGMGFGGPGGVGRAPTTRTALLTCEDRAERRSDASHLAPPATYGSETRCRALPRVQRNPAGFYALSASARPRRGIMSPQPRSNRTGGSTFG